MEKQFFDDLRQSGSVDEFVEVLSQVPLRVSGYVSIIRRHVKNTMIDSLDEGVLGQAILGQQGSTKIDLMKCLSLATSEEHFEEILVDVINHEQEHEKQSDSWNALEVVLDSGETITQTDIVETAAMSVQKNLDHVSNEYKKIYDRVLNVTDLETVHKIAKEGDLLSLAA